MICTYSNNEMSGEKLKCNFPNYQLTDEELTRIETKARHQNHLSASYNLKDLIKSDEKRLARYNITFDQLGIFFDKLKSHYHYQMNHQNYYSGTIVDYLQNRRSFRERKFANNILGSNIIATSIEWMGAEQCPFQSLDDRKYHGHEYGCRDWLFINIDTNKSLFVGDLLFHEIAKHHFFQSLESDYHIDVDELIGFFQLDSKLKSYMNFEIKEVYTSSCSLGSSHYRYDKDGQLQLYFDKKFMDKQVEKLMEGMAGLRYSV